MKKILFIIPILLIGCKTSKTVYIPVENVKTVIQVVHDTTIKVKLDVLRDSIVTNDTLSVLSNKYSYSYAKWSNNRLYHSLSIKDINLPIKIQYINTNITDSVNVPYLVEKIKEVNILTRWQIFRLRALNMILIIIFVYCLWKFRKPLMRFIFKI